MAALYVIAGMLSALALTWLLICLAKWTDRALDKVFGGDSSRENS